MENAIFEIVQQWRSEEVKLHPGVLLTSIEGVEKMIGFIFPVDFKELYTQVDGFADFDMRENMFSIWPLGVIVDEYERDDDKEYVGFSDYLIHSHSIGFLKGRAGIFKNYGRGEYILIANSFIEAIQLINSDAAIIY